jgi:PIN domain nuclease of toxin-antitoxin system
MNDELDNIHQQVQNLVALRIEDIRADLRSAIARCRRLGNHPALSVGDSAAVIGIRQTLEHAESCLENLQTERGKRAIH